MIFEYDELKECVAEDFNRFFKQMEFNEKQIFPAILNEYEHNENFCQVENICIHTFIAMNYVENGLNDEEIVDKLKRLINEETQNEISDELGKEYPKFNKDISIIIGDK